MSSVLGSDGFDPLLGLKRDFLPILRVVAAIRLGGVEVGLSESEAFALGRDFWVSQLEAAANVSSDE